jgi:hypothetical protein
MKFSRHQIKLGKFVSSLPVHAGYCADCLSELYDEPLEDVGAYPRGTGVLSYPHIVATAVSTSTHSRAQHSA